MIWLRGFTTSDVPRLLSWIDGPEALTLWSGRDSPGRWDEAQLVAYAARALPTQRIWAVHAHAAEVVGHVELGMQRVGLGVFIHNTTAIGLYERLRLVRRESSVRWYA